ncbi:cupin domain-containing protein [Desulfovibrio mangrovi]|uniref:helix-turn-helix domain-containing protein n=1 Tax=Desulfovibrio mangrovi TaxID=2976983 RepID=UPI00224689D8|nr:cupin domain-containing protein [Desulfovibrio mangrovi]UZP67782.1 cupin domain-containing protein [Desulfovibrio mangrovi]
METGQAYVEIAPRLMGLREAVGFTVEELAAKIGVRPETVALYEEGETEIPVSYLKDVAGACGVDITSLISGHEAHLHDYTLVRKGQGLSVTRREDYDYLHLASRFTNKRMEPFLVTVPPKDENELVWNEHGGQEFIYLLKGRLEIWLDQRRHELVPGDSIYFDSKIPHALRGLDEEEAVFLDVIS